MRWLAFIGAAVLAACYGEPTSTPACAITCEDSCPGDLTCAHGYCVADGQTCESTFREVSAGNGFGCALDTQDLLWCWGANTYHQLDASDIDLVPRATQIGTRRWDSISTGGGHICGLRDGHLYCWGRNDRGQVSDVIAGDAVEPFELAPPTPNAKWSFVAAGYNDTCAIANGALYCWGAGDNGQLGNGTADDIGTPTPVMTTLADWTFVDTNAGRYYNGSGGNAPWTHACAISASAGLHCWGRNAYGELGDGTTTDRAAPVAVALPSPPTSVAVSEWTTCATTESQQLYCWGSDGYYALGDANVVTPQLGGASYAATPILASDLTGFTKVDGGEWYACALRADEVWCFGSVQAGGLGNGLFEGQNWGQAAVGASDLSVGWNANVDDEGYDAADLDLACMIADGEIRCWGDNRYGQLGQGGATMRPKPSEVAGDHRFSTIAAGGSHVCGIENGNLLCWGSTTHGEANGIVAGTVSVPCGSAPGLACNVPSPTQLVLAPTADEVTLGLTHGCARSGASVTCWGDNSSLQLGAAGASPIKLTGAFDKLLSVGSFGQCAKQGTEMWCWGSVLRSAIAAQHVSAFDTFTTVGVSGSLDTSSYVTYFSFGCALDATNQLSCFGDNYYYAEFGNGYYDSNLTYCGNGMCDNGENADVCGDCGSPPLTNLGRTYTALSVSWPTLYDAGTYGYNQTPYTCGIRPDSQIECWGYTYRGGIGPSSFNYYPAIIEGLSGCTAVATSTLHTCGLCGGDIYCWGDHRFGAVGAGAITLVAITTPRKVDIALGEPFVQLVSGIGFSCARTQSGRAYCWGFSRDGALGSGGASSPLPVAVQLAP